MRNSIRLTSSVGIVLVGLASVIPATAGAQDRSGSGRQAVQRWPGGQDAQPAPRAQVPVTPRNEPAPAPQVRVPEPQRQDQGDLVFAQRQAQPRGGRPQGGNPRTGTAVPRGGVRSGPGRPGGGSVYVQPRGSVRGYNYGPRYISPYAYAGALGWGLGYYANDPWGWYPGWGYGYSGVYGYNGWGGYGYGGYPYGGSGYGYGGVVGGGYAAGRLRLQVKPRDAEVYIDGYYAGVVDDFDGRFQGANLEAGGYSIEVRAPGLEPLQFDVRVTPGRTTTYRGELLPQRP